MAAPWLARLASQLRAGQTSGLRGVGGRFVSRAQAERLVGVDSYLAAQLGAAPTGNSWVQIAAKYHERFSDFLEGFEG